MTTINIDYITTSFEYPVLTKIQGQPTYVTLKIIKDEMKANATSVSSDLGGGANGHLGLMLSPIEYSNVSLVPYVKSVHPGTLVIPLGSTQHESTRLREDFKEELRQYRECTQVEKALIKQLGTALPQMYLRGFRNAHTNTITTDIPTLLEHLFTTYGAVEPEELKEQEDILRQKVFNIGDPLIILFNEVEELQELATASGNPFSPVQQLTIGIQLIKNFNDFETGLTSWFDLPTIDKTWPRFKTHFESARASLRRVRGVTMRNTAYHQQANLITTQVLQEIRTDHSRVIDELRNTGNTILQAMQVSQRYSKDKENEPPVQQESANTVTGNSLQVDMLKTLQLMQKQIQDLQNNQQISSGDDGRKKRQPKQRVDTSEYCWTHGAWGHKGKDCRRKATGHKDKATFANRMGGSNYCCPVTE